MCDFWEINCFLFYCLPRPVGGAVITSAPRNLTVKEGQVAEFPCTGQAHPGNLSVSWFRGGFPIKTIGSLARRAQVRPDNSLYLNKVMAEDQGKWACELTNGIGQPVGASAYLAVECKILSLKLSDNFFFTVVSPSALTLGT